MLARWLGRRHDSGLVRDLRAAYGAPDVDDRGTSVLYQFPSEGLEVHIGGPEQIVELVAVNDGTEGTTRYPGELPEGIAFGWTRERVEARLGSPDRSNRAESFYDGTSFSLALEFSERHGLINVGVYRPQR